MMAAARALELELEPVRGLRTLEDLTSISREIRRATELRPESPLIRLVSGKVWKHVPFMQGIAVNELRKALELDPRLSKAREILTDLESKRQPSGGGER